MCCLTWLIELLGMIHFVLFVLARLCIHLVDFGTDSDVVGVEIGVVRWERKIPAIE